MKKGFTLVEVLVGAAIFVIVAVAAYNAYISLFQLIQLNQYRVLALELANEQFEIARNMPYDSVGVQGSIPNGSIPHTRNIVRGGTSFTVTTIVRNIDLPFDGVLGGNPNDLSPADNKLVEITVSCDGCRGMSPITLDGQVAPKNLEMSSSNGALFIRVFNANGQPVQGASVHVVNVATTTTIVIDDVTDDNGSLQLVDIPPSNNAYRIIVSKAGYSTDRTYPYGDPGNPNPTKPDSTVLSQQVTQVSFAIDALSSMHFSAVTPTCASAGVFGFNIAGSKQIGVNLPKYTFNAATDASGKLDLNNIEWDSYTITPTDGSQYLSGINPLNPTAINPDSSVNLQLILVPKNPNTLLVTVRDSSTLLPLSGANVELIGPNGFDKTSTTGQGYLSQTDWSGGSGQNAFSDPTKYFEDDGGVDVSTSSGQIILKNISGVYGPNGMLESSTFDTGSASNFYSFSWMPIDQPILVGPNAVRLQFATNATITPTTTWAFKGSDGTIGSYYTSANSPINPIHNGDEFARYRVYMSTQTATVTPNLSDVAFTYTSACVPPGQVLFNGLPAGSYKVKVSKSGYADYSADTIMENGWQETKVNLGP